MRTHTAPIRRAAAVAAATPDSRNRYVDFLRALSIMAVVIGHWLIAAPVATGDTLEGVNMLAHSPWTQWLTWVFQGMPVFFAVGGYLHLETGLGEDTGGHCAHGWLVIHDQNPALPLPRTSCGLGFDRPLRDAGYRR